MQTWDAIVIGAGATGLSAAQMLGRARRRTLVIDAGAPRNRFAAHMHGVLGQDGTAPGDLLATGRAELARYGVAVRRASVRRVDTADARITVRLEDDSILSARAVVVATGITDELPPIPGVAEHWGGGVLHCPYCHGWEVRDRRLGVLLVSPLQAHQAQLVRQWSDDVVVFAAVPLEPESERRLRARGVEIVTEDVVEVIGDGHEVTGVRLRGGRIVPIDALFTMGRAQPHDGFLRHLDLMRSETPVGAFLEVDAMGRTSHPRIWAAGNVVSPQANVPQSMGAGAMAGAAVNGALVEEDTAAAVFWQERYENPAWSGLPNATMVDIVGGLTPGRALDLGSGEGADTIWLAQHGWDATGADLSSTAVQRARHAAAEAGASARFVVADLSAESIPGDVDLVTASFFQSPVALDRIGALRRAAARVAPGGHLLVVTHAAPPSWASPEHVGAHAFTSPDEDIAALELDLVSEWSVEIAEVRTRSATAPDGSPATLDDAVVLLRRRR